jgi:hypothetical protein
VEERIRMGFCKKGMRKGKKVKERKKREVAPQPCKAGFE